MYKILEYDIRVHTKEHMDLYPDTIYPYIAIITNNKNIFFISYNYPYEIDNFLNGKLNYINEPFKIKNKESLLFAFRCKDGKNLKLFRNKEIESLYQRMLLYERDSKFNKLLE